MESTIQSNGTNHFPFPWAWHDRDPQAILEPRDKVVASRERKGWVLVESRMRERHGLK
jgi:hypothetical protein